LLISAPSDDEDDYRSTLHTHAPVPTLQALKSLLIDESQTYSARNELLVGDPLLLTPSYILVAKPATFVRDYRAHGDPTVIIAFDLGPRNTDHQRACTVYALESFRSTPSSVRSMLFRSVATTAPSTMAQSLVLPKWHSQRPLHSALMLLAPRVVARWHG
jgi:hypothetical protein